MRERGNGRPIYALADYTVERTGKGWYFGLTSGTNGYGIGDNAGLLEFKNSGGAWESLQAIVFNLVGRTGSWAVSGNSIYNSNSGNVGIGTARPTSMLEVRKDIGANHWIMVSNLASGDASAGLLMRSNATNALVMMPRVDPENRRANQDGPAGRRECRRGCRLQEPEETPRLRIQYLGIASGHRKGQNQIFPRYMTVFPGH